MTKNARPLLWLKQPQLKPRSKNGISIKKNYDCICKVINIVKDVILLRRRNTGNYYLTVSVPLVPLICYCA